MTMPDPRFARLRETMNRCGTGTVDAAAWRACEQGIARGVWPGVEALATVSRAAGVSVDWVIGAEAQGAEPTAEPVLYEDTRLDWTPCGMLAMQIVMTDRIVELRLEARAAERLARAMGAAMRARELQVVPVTSLRHSFMA